jgi:hypothetical protein
LPPAQSDELRQLDERMQLQIVRQFGSLAHVCTTSSNIMKTLEAAMVTEMTAAVTAKLPEARIVQMYMERHPRPEDAVVGLTTAFAEARPQLASGDGRTDEIAIVALPAVAKDDPFCKLADETLPTARQVATGWNEEIVFYREQPSLSLSSLPQIGPAGQEAYLQMVGAEHFPPHSRYDIGEWLPLRQMEAEPSSQQKALSPDSQAKGQE